MREPLTFPALGTTAALLVEPDDAVAPAREILADEIDAIDLACSRFRDDSELARINRRADSWMGVSPLFVEALDVGLRGARPHRWPGRPDDRLRVAGARLRP